MYNCLCIILLLLRPYVSWRTIISQKKKFILDISKLDDRFFFKKTSFLPSRPYRMKVMFTCPVARESNELSNQGHPLETITDYERISMIYKTIRTTLSRHMYNYCVIIIHTCPGDTVFTRRMSRHHTYLQRVTVTHRGCNLLRDHRCADCEIHRGNNTRTRCVSFRCHCSSVIIGRLATECIRCCCCCRRR